MREARSATSRACVTITMVAPPALQPGQEVEDLGLAVGVQVARGLVGQHDGRARDDRPRDGDALLLATGELAGQMLGAVAEPDGVEGLGRSRWRSTRPTRE